MSKIQLRSAGVKNSFRMFRVRPSRDPEDVKNEIMELMNDYLEQNDGKLINMVVLKNKEILCYFVVGEDCTDTSTWETSISRQILKDYDVIPSVIELGPFRPQSQIQMQTQQQHPQQFFQNQRQQPTFLNQWESEYPQKQLQPYYQ